jgi:hypothetical protein
MDPRFYFHNASVENDNATPPSISWIRLTQKIRCIYTYIHRYMSTVMELIHIGYVHQGCKMFLGTIDPNGGNILNDHKICMYTKWA